MRGSGSAWWLFVAIAAGAAGAAACGAGDPPNAPSAPSGYGGADDDGGVTIPVTTHHEAGTDDDAGSSGATGDAGSLVFPDAGSFEPLGPECVNQTAADPLEVRPDGKFVNALSSPVDLGVTRVETTWGGNCAAPTIRITLSDGRCPKGKGHEVEFQFDARTIATGKLGRGVQYLEPEPGNVPVRVRYRRPTSLDPVGAGEWGTCLGVTGTLDLPLTPGVDARDELRGRFTMELAPCDDKTADTRSVNGSFDVTLRRGLDDVCPPMK